MQERDKISTGPNARPRNENIAQTAAGAPNDSSRAPEVNQDEVERQSRKTGQDQARDRSQGHKDQPGAEGERGARADEDTYD